MSGFLDISIKEITTKAKTKRATPINSIRLCFLLMTFSFSLIEKRFVKNRVVTSATTTKIMPIIISVFTVYLLYDYAFIQTTKLPDFGHNNALTSHGTALDDDKYERLFLITIQTLCK